MKNQMNSDILGSSNIQMADMKIQEKINMLCERAEISKTDLARLFRVTTSTVVNMSDKNPKSKILLSALILLQTFSGLTGEKFLQYIEDVSFNDEGEENAH